MLKQRIITAVIALIALLVVLFVVPPIVAGVAIVAVILLGAWEWSGFLQVSGLPLRILYVATIAALLVLVSLPLASYTETILQVALVWWLGALIWTFFFPTQIPALVRWIGGALLLVPLYLALTTILVCMVKRSFCFMNSRQSKTT